MNKLYCNIDECLNHLNEEQLNDFISKYYSKNFKTKLLVEEYKININPSKITSILPQIIHYDKICPNCNSYMVSQLLAKTLKKRMKVPKCPICSHEESSFCNCPVCTQKREEEHERIEKERKDIRHRKQLLINETYKLDKYEPVNIDKISFRHKVFLGALLRLASNEDMKTINPLNSLIRTLAPTLSYSKIILDELVSNNIILVSPKSEIEAFVDSPDNSRFPNTYLINKVCYILNIEFKDSYEVEINDLINPDKINDCDKEEALTIWKEIALEECLEYLKFQMNSVKFDYSAGDKTNIVFKDLLNNFSVSQVFGIIYKSICNATRYYQQDGISKKQAANSVIGGCQRYAERALIKNWDLTKFHRPNELAESSISEILFNRITEIGDSGFHKPPSSL